MREDKVVIVIVTGKSGEGYGESCFIRDHCVCLHCGGIVSRTAGLSRLDFVINTTEHKGKHKEKENIWNIFDAINTLFKLNCFFMLDDLVWQVRYIRQLNVYIGWSNRTCDLKWGSRASWAPAEPRPSRDCWLLCTEQKEQNYSRTIIISKA